MYIFLNENEILKYSGEILKRFVGNKLIKTIANPTEKDLKEFGYMEYVSPEPYEVGENEALILKYKKENEKIIGYYITERID